MGTLKLTRDGVALAAVAVVLERGPEQPPVRGRIVRNAPSGTVAQSDTHYIDPVGSLSWPNNANRVTVTGAVVMPGFVRGWQDVWVEGRPDRPMVLGPGVDTDLMQIKRYPTATGMDPADLTFRYFLMRDLTRTGSKHTDGLQLMAGKRIRFIDGESRNVNTQPWFVKDSGDTAGGGVLEDIEFRRLYVHACPGAIYAFRISGDAQDAHTPTRVKIVDCRSDMNWSIDPMCAAAGCEAINFQRT